MATRYHYFEAGRYVGIFQRKHVFGKVTQKWCYYAKDATLTNAAQLPMAYYPYAWHPKPLCKPKTYKEAVAVLNHLDALRDAGLVF